MPFDPRTDELAQEAARLIDARQAANIPDAVRQAVEATGWTHVPRPTARQIRRHAQGLAMQALGEQGYRESIRDVWRIAERIMSILESFEPRLLGRGAKGQIDAGVTLYIRIFTRRRIGEIAQMLVSAGFAEPQFETVDSKHFGRFDRMRFVENGIEVAVTRCVPERDDLAAVDLHTGRPLPSLDLSALRRRIEESETADEHG